ncbi:LysR family transcriptional regulator [Allostreptomyces psammosilenae]|uniref:DNA-binding transcriptional LysR family regulator n=1 Tax=Allostreptomyces psammosilenae TaxID=1892865 RepID=A0A853AC05_9ACTN|nr:LysR family transcriptional regulator [Allostreptomyces psammosilenae]NYI08008.1 DNA-binding transcriptional LysR family regulator [Allostreptomyces psammosilenae]
MPPGSEELLLSLAPRLAQFVAVARHQHVTRAAAETGVPQPTLSRAVARLEQELGVDLLARSGRSVRLTRAGRELFEVAERVLGELATGVERVRSGADPTAGRVAFGFLHTLGTEAVPGLLSEFRAKHPGIRFQLVQDHDMAVQARLRAGQLDLCLTSPVPDAPDITARKLGEQRLHLVVPPGHRLAGRRRIRLAEAAGDDFVTLESGYGLRRITDELCARAGFTPRVAFEGEEVATLRGLVAAGLGVALLPSSVARRPDVVELDVTAPRAVRQIGLAWLTGHEAPPPVVAFRQFVLARRAKLLRGEEGEWRPDTP